MVKLTQIPKHNEKILVKQVDDTVVLLSLDGGQYYALDEIGGRVWELCDATRSVSNIIQIICDEYDAPPETIQTDVLELLEDLMTENILAQEPPSPPPAQFPAPCE